MSFAEFLKFVHVVAAIIWVGGPVVVEIIGRRAMGRGGSAVIDFGRDAELLGRLFGAAALAVLGFGIWLVADREYISFSDGWVVVSLALTVVLVLAGPLFFAPQSKALVADGMKNGGDDPSVKARAELIQTVARLDTAVAFFVVFLMVVKPWS